MKKLANKIEILKVIRKANLSKLLIWINFLQLGMCHLLLTAGIYRLLLTAWHICSLWVTTWHL